MIISYRDLTATKVVMSPDMQIVVKGRFGNSKFLIKRDDVDKFYHVLSEQLSRPRMVSNIRDVKRLIINNS